MNRNSKLVSKMAKNTTEKNTIKSKHCRINQVEKLYVKN